MNDRTDERVAQYFSLYFWLFWPKVWLCNCDDLRAGRDLTHALQSRTTKNLDESTGPLALSFAHSFVGSDLLALPARWAALIRSFACSLTHSRARGKANHQMLVHQAVLNHRAHHFVLQYTATSGVCLASVYLGFTLA